METLRRVRDHPRVFAFYNTSEEVDKLADAVQDVIEVFA